MLPTAIPNVTAAVLAPLRSGFGRFVQTFSSPFSSSTKKKPQHPPQSRIVHGNNTAAQLNPDPPSPVLNRMGTAEGLEMFDSGKDPLALEGTKAERR